MSETDMSANATPFPVSVWPLASSAAGHASGFRVREATLLDVEALVALVNVAYRPGAGLGGWTHEADLLTGARIGPAQMRELLSRPDSVILVGQRDQRLAACVHVRKIGASSCIGMLAVEPKWQGRGLGSEMLKQAESYALLRFLSETVVMTVISRRAELMSFYHARGYRPTGETEAYPLLAGVGSPRFADLELSKLAKRLRA